MQRQDKCNQGKQHTSYRNATSEMKCGHFADLITRHILQEIQNKLSILSHHVDSILNIAKVDEASFQPHAEGPDHVNRKKPFFQAGEQNTSKVLPFTM